MHSKIKKGIDFEEKFKFNLILKIEFNKLSDGQKILPIHIKDCNDDDTFFFKKFKILKNSSTRLDFISINSFDHQNLFMITCLKKWKEKKTSIWQADLTIGYLMLNFLSEEESVFEETCFGLCSIGGESISKSLDLAIDCPKLQPSSTGVLASDPSRAIIFDRLSSSRHLSITSS
ncbi:hypothetical protein BpHYR1_016526 [Brachionus plicatilis]|uniref:Uncharacterized protein n=1 Tax=Brachionus plicatilis TaxID=10195 RepID=A0A3M7R7H1_BRAPC|nr:hypothetical protein BpHYR1_016526 [Brachionus plicatilis]